MHVTSTQSPWLHFHIVLAVVSSFTQVLINIGQHALCVPCQFVHTHAVNVFSIIIFANVWFYVATLDKSIAFAILSLLSCIDCF